MYVIGRASWKIGARRRQ